MEDLAGGEAIGYFEVTSGKLVVTDPCYDRSTWCMGYLEKVKNGTWEAFAHYSDDRSWGDRVAKLVVFHKDHRYPKGFPQVLRDDEGKRVDIGVDSGQAGFFDDGVYPDGDRDDKGGEFGGKDKFYDDCCKATIGEDFGSKGGEYPNHGIVQDRGVVSSSGYGDGSYECSYWVEDGLVVAAEIVFIDDDAEDEDDITEDEEEDDMLLPCGECGEDFPEDELDINGVCPDCKEDFEEKEDEK